MADAGGAREAFSARGEAVPVEVLTFGTFQSDVLALCLICNLEGRGSSTGKEGEEWSSLALCAAAMIINNCPGLIEATQAK